MGEASVVSVQKMKRKIIDVNLPLAPNPFLQIISDCIEKYRSLKQAQNWAKVADDWAGVVL